MRAREEERSAIWSIREKWRLAYAILFVTQVIAATVARYVWILDPDTDGRASGLWLNLPENGAAAAVSTITLTEGLDIMFNNWLEPETQSTTGSKDAGKKRAKRGTKKATKRAAKRAAKRAYSKLRHYGKLGSTGCRKPRSTDFPSTNHRLKGKTPILKHRTQPRTRRPMRCGLASPN